MCRSAAPGLAPITASRSVPRNPLILCTPGGILAANRQVRDVRLASGSRCGAFDALRTCSLAHIYAQYPTLRSFSPCCVVMGDSGRLQYSTHISSGYLGCGTRMTSRFLSSSHCIFSPVNGLVKYAGAATRNSLTLDSGISESRSFS